MIQPRPVRSCLRSTKQGFDISLSSCFCLHGAAVCLWFGVKLARPSSEGSSVFSVDLLKIRELNMLKAAAGK